MKSSRRRPFVRCQATTNTLTDIPLSLMETQHRHGLSFRAIKFQRD